MISFFVGLGVLVGVLYIPRITIGVLLIYMGCPILGWIIIVTMLITGLIKLGTTTGITRKK